MKKISPYSLLSDIFDNLNNTVCSDCPEANISTTMKEHKKFVKSSCIPEGMKSDYMYECRSKEMGCCSFCAEKKGHLSHNDGDPAFESLSEYFDEEHGFFDNVKKTCKLPREKRSLCCLKYTCFSLKNILVKKHGFGIIKFIENTIKQIKTERTTK